jgi:hypothetical protein
MNTKIDNQQIVVGMRNYCYSLHQYFPAVVDKKYIEQVHSHMVGIIQSTRTTEKEKQEELLKGLDYLPLMKIVGDRAILLPPLILGSNDEKTKRVSTNRIY